MLVALVVIANAVVEKWYEMMAFISLVLFTICAYVMPSTLGAFCHAAKACVKEAVAECRRPMYTAFSRRCSAQKP